MNTKDREIIFEDDNFRIVFVPKFLRTGNGEKWAYDLIWEASNRTDAMGEPIWEPTNQRQSLRENRHFENWAETKRLVDRIYSFLFRKLHGDDSNDKDGKNDISQQAKAVASEFLGYDDTTAIDDNAKELFWKLHDVVKGGIDEAVQNEREQIIRMAENRKLDKFADAIRERSKLDVK